MNRAIALVLCLAVAASASPAHKLRRPHGKLTPNPDYKPSYVPKIVGGQEAEPGQFPWQVSLQTNGGFHFCGSIIMDENTIITAAHCVDGDSPSQLKVHVGEHSLDNNDGTEAVYAVRSIVVHEDYGVFGGNRNDIALLLLAEPMSMSNAVQGVKMPSQGQSFAAGSDSVVSGWGTTDNGTPDIMHYVVVPVVSDEECTDAYGSSMDAQTMICAGDTGIDSCQGDSGGPLTCGNDILCGIVSWGIGCGSRGYPGVYAEASNYIDWIADNQ
jgi:trypsin